MRARNSASRSTPWPSLARKMTMSVTASLGSFAGLPLRPLLRLETDLPALRFAIWAAIVLQPSRMASGSLGLFRRVFSATVQAVEVHHRWMLSNLSAAFDQA